MGDLCRKDLVLELMGKHSNLIFCDDNGTIIDSIKRVSAQTSSVREVLPEPCTLLRRHRKSSTRSPPQRDAFCQSVFSKPMKLAKAIYSSYTGISPVIAEELCHRASLESDQSANTIQEMARLHLYHLFDLMMEDIKQHRYTPLIVSDCHGDPVEFSFPSAYDVCRYADHGISDDL